MMQQFHLHIQLKRTHMFTKRRSSLMKCPPAVEWLNFKIFTQWNIIWQRGGTNHNYKQKHKVQQKKPDTKDSTLNGSTYTCKMLKWAKLTYGVRSQESGNTLGIRSGRWGMMRF